MIVYVEAWERGPDGIGAHVVRPREVVERERCRRCGAAIVWRRGPQWSGWVALELVGHLRDVCEAVLERPGETVVTWLGHEPERGGDR